MSSDRALTVTELKAMFEAVDNARLAEMERGTTAECERCGQPISAGHGTLCTPCEQRDDNAEDETNASI